MESDRRKTGRPAGQTKLETEEIRGKCVALAKRGYSQQAIGFELELSRSAVQQHLAIYRASLTPSMELAEEWRETKIQRAEERFRRLGARALGQQNAAGEWIVEPDLQALAALQKEEDAISKLLGANVEQGGIRVSVTREALAALLYAVDEPVIEVEAKEITDGEADIDE